MVKVIRSSSVDLSQKRVVAEFATMAEARQYIQRNTVDGLNVSKEIECDYLHTDGEGECMRFSSDCMLCIIWADGSPVRFPNNDDLRRVELKLLPVREDLTDAELQIIDGWMNS